MILPLHVFTHTIYISGANTVSKWVFDTPELELEMVTRLLVCRTMELAWPSCLERHAL